MAIKMKQTALSCYPHFCCIADRCRHSCCVGWEIDIDSETLDIYRNTGGAFGERLRNNIQSDGETACFRLDEKERCPFLNAHNLCDIILTFGENHLCQICTDHPRFRNFFSDRTEIGLGLCCEAAGRLILGAEEKLYEITLDDDEKNETLTDFEQHLLSVRTELFSILQNRTEPIGLRVQKMLAAQQIHLPKKSMAEWAEFYLGLERLDPAWGTLLTALCDFGEPDISVLREDLDIPFEQLLLYFLYRHLANAEDSNGLRARITFSVLSFQMIRALCAFQMQTQGSCTLDELVEFARLYSAEIEYSEENMEALLALLQPRHKIFGTRDESKHYIDRIGAYLIAVQGALLAVVQTPKGYFLPGGKMEQQESPAECIKREVSEETGYCVTVGDFIGSAESYLLHPEIGWFHPVQYYYSGVFLERTCVPIEPDHCLEWIPCSDLNGKFFAEQQEWAVKQYLSDRNKAK